MRAIVQLLGAATSQHLDPRSRERHRPELMDARHGDVQPPVGEGEIPRRAERSARFVDGAA